MGISSTLLCCSLPYSFITINLEGWQAVSPESHCLHPNRAAVIGPHDHA